MESQCCHQLNSTSYKGWEEVEITVDSGACDTVMPESTCKGIEIEESKASPEGVVYEAAGGDSELPNLGQRRCLLMTLGAQNARKITFQVADIHKPLLSVSRVADAGFECRLGKYGGVLMDLQNGESIPITRRHNLYMLKAWVNADTNTKNEFTRQE